MADYKFKHMTEEQMEKLADIWDDYEDVLMAFAEDCGDIAVDAFMRGYEQGSKDGREDGARHAREVKKGSKK